MYSVQYKYSKQASNRTESPGKLKSPRIRINPITLENLANKLASPIGVTVKTRKYLLRSYPNSFIASEVVDWISNWLKCSRSFAISVANELKSAKFIVSFIEVEKPFLDGTFFYYFSVCFFIFD